MFCGLCFKPADENDEALHGCARYENGCIDDPKRVVIGDGFYAFVYSGAPAEDCRHVPGFNKNRWYEDQDGNLVRTEDGPPLDSTQWWHYSGENSSGYARISPLQDLLDRDGCLGNELRNWTHDALEKTVTLWTALFERDG